MLASRSPQRRALLVQLGLRFTVCEPGYIEHDRPDTPPRQLVVRHARGKALSVAGELVLGVDTAVAIEGTGLGKPAGADEARSMLLRLAGREHIVYSGLCLRHGDAEHVRLAATRVRFRPLDEADVAWYVESGEWRGRAGGYAVQGLGAALVATIDGDYTNVVGLPVPALLDVLCELAAGGDC